jgi:hypothetical protein
MIKQKLPRKKKCKGCGLVFHPLRQLQATCSIPCAIKHGEETKRKKEAREHRENKAKLKTIPQLKREAQQACNAYVRYRDKDLPCICCGLPLTNDFNNGLGGQYDAGHYRSVASAPHLRFDERNIHAQRKSCNQWGSGRAVDYRLGLIARFDVHYVEAIEADQTVKKYTRDDLIAIKKYYQAKLKALKAEG